MWILSALREVDVTDFTQVAWAETSYLGCGYAHYKARQNPDPHFPFQKIFACHYAPGGNINGASMYKRGATCSACPDGTTCDSASGLCHTPGASDGNGKSESSGGSGTLWIILACGLLGILAATGVAIGYLYANSGTAALSVTQ
ncbi:venom allergen 5-like [Rhipicephalus sanguineus]|uniref:venom allergen 5-like n=1 Tax=Rhipicephalus sanguineus TaxID=34632 RepID=UPI0020C4C8CA|nr:venom allergen 5-like [Rhipicephalus sanguineus]XP_049268581.1 venom allergen 5-like [Rhipicephalus sanguineus]